MSMKFRMALPRRRPFPLRWAQFGAGCADLLELRYRDLLGPEHLSRWTERVQDVSASGTLQERNGRLAGC